MPLITGDTELLRKIQQLVHEQSHRMQRPTSAEVIDAKKFLDLVDQFLGGFDKEIYERQAFAPLDANWVNQLEPVVWQSYFGASLSASAINLVSLEVSMHLAYLVVFASGEKFVWSDELLAMFDNDDNQDE